MMRAIRCTECRERFYTPVTENPPRTCQNCAGTHDGLKQAEKDAKAVKAANKAHKAAQPQTIDPRKPS
jgi:hypothetical protein